MAFYYAEGIYPPAGLHGHSDYIFLCESVLVHFPSHHDFLKRRVKHVFLVHLQLTETLDWSDQKELLLWRCPKPAAFFRASAPAGVGRLLPIVQPDGLLRQSDPKILCSLIGKKLSEDGDCVAKTPFG